MSMPADQTVPHADEPVAPRLPDKRLEPYTTPVLERLGKWSLLTMQNSVGISSSGFLR